MQSECGLYYSCLVLDVLDIQLVFCSVFYKFKVNSWLLKVVDERHAIEAYERRRI